MKLPEPQTCSYIQYNGTRCGAKLSQPPTDGLKAPTCDAHLRILAERAPKCRLCNNRLHRTDAGLNGLCKRCSGLA